jgi:hypothetical protein
MSSLDMLVGFIGVLMTGVVPGVVAGVLLSKFNSRKKVVNTLELELLYADVELKKRGYF